MFWMKSSDKDFGSLNSSRYLSSKGPLTMLSLSRPDVSFPRRRSAETSSASSKKEFRNRGSQEVISAVTERPLLVLGCQESARSNRAPSTVPSLRGMQEGTQENCPVATCRLRTLQLDGTRNIGGFNRAIRSSSSPSMPSNQSVFLNLDALEALTNETECR